MDKALYEGTVPLDWLKLPPGVTNWQPYQTEDIFATGFITVPKEYMFTMGSGVEPFGAVYKSLATTPAFALPTATQFYVAGRDVIRWGGPSDPMEIDFDHYLFTPDETRGVAVVSKAPKSEVHHFSGLPNPIDRVPETWQEFCEAIQSGFFR